MEQTLAYYVPCFVSQIVIMGWMAQGRVMPVMSDVTQLLAATQIVKAVAHGLLKPKGHKFHVTAKGGDRSRRLVQWPLLKMFATLLAFTVAGVIWAFLIEDGSKLRDSSALCLFWSWYNILILTLACVVCVEQPRLRSSERLSSRDMAVMLDGRRCPSPVASSTFPSAAHSWRVPLRRRLAQQYRLASVSPKFPAKFCVPAERVSLWGSCTRRRRGPTSFASSTLGDTQRLLPKIEPGRVAAAVFRRVLR